MVRFIPVMFMALALITSLGMLGACMRNGNIGGYFQYTLGFALMSIGLAFMIG